MERRKIMCDNFDIPKDKRTNTIGVNDTKMFPRKKIGPIKLL
jgi:hypothetical protein